MDFSLEMITVPALVVGVLFFLLLAFWGRYKTVGPDTAMIITGSLLGTRNVAAEEGRKMKIVRGGGAFVVPIFQKVEYISLLSHKLDVTTPEVYTELGVPVLADGVAIIKVGGSVEAVATAAEQFLGKPTESMDAEAQEVLEGHLRAILGSMTVEEVYRNRDKFAQEVQAVAALDLKKMGLLIVSFTIKDVRDKQGYLEALGRPRIAAVKRDAEVAEAQATRDAKIQKAKAEEEWMKAELVRDTNVAEATKDNTLKIASFKKEQDTAKAEADQAYAIQEARAQQTVVEEQLRIEIVKKERAIDIESKEIQRREKQFDAEVKKKADADRYAVEQKAEAEKVRRMRDAEAQQYEIEARARANASQQRLEGEAAADATRARGTAEAEIVRLKGLAEAEAKEKLAEAFQKYGEAAVFDILAKMLPDLAGRIAEPLKNIEKLTVIDSGGGTGAARVGNYVAELFATSNEMLKGVAGIDLQEIVKGLIEKKGEGAGGKGEGVTDAAAVIETR